MVLAENVFGDKRLFVMMHRMLIEMHIVRGLCNRMYCCFVAHFKFFMDTVSDYFIVVAFVESTAGAPPAGAGAGAFAAITWS